MLSVLIPTYKRKESLLEALSSLQDQVCRDFEILVIDNANEQDVLQAVKDFNINARISAKYIAEPKLGLNHARHAGVRSASGQVLVFTDDDATFAPDWLSAYEEAFNQYPEMMAAGGPVRPIWETEPPEWLSDYMSYTETYPIFSLMERGNKLSVSSDGTFFGVNMAIRKSVFEWTGFRPELYGPRTIGDGESGLNEDLRKNGHLVGYVPGAAVYHHIPASRMSLAYIKRWAWHLGGAQMYRRWQGRRRGFKSIVSEYFIIINQYLLYWLKSLFSNGRKDPKSINTQFQASLGWCKLKYLFWVISDEKVKNALDMTRFNP